MVRVPTLYDLAHQRGLTTAEVAMVCAEDKFPANADATEYTFDLRTDVTYSDGSPLTAANARASLTCARSSLMNFATRLFPCTVSSRHSRVYWFRMKKTC